MWSPLKKRATVLVRKLYIRCMLCTHIARYSCVCHVYTSHTHRNVAVCIPRAHIALYTLSAFHRISARRFAVMSTLILPATISVSGHAPELIKRKQAVASERRLRPAQSGHYTFLTSVHPLIIKK